MNDRRSSLALCGRRELLPVGLQLRVQLLRLVEVVDPRPHVVGVVELLGGAVAEAAGAGVAEHDLGGKQFE